jgi:hypothetical protein
MGLADIIGAIGDAISSIGSDIAAFLNSAIAILWNDIQVVASVLQSVAAALWSALSTIWGWLTNAWDWLHTNVIAPIVDWIQNVTEWFSELIAPLKQWIQQWIAMYRWYWENIIKPGLDFIQRLRSFLVIFRLAGFKWAQELDAYLSNVEFKVENAFLAVWQNLNLLANWINFLVDPFGNIQGAVLLGSISPIAGAIYAALWGLQNGSLAAGSQAWSQGIFSQFSDSSVQQGAQTELTIGTQPADDAMVQQLEQIRSSLAAGQSPFALAL